MIGDYDHFREPLYFNPDYDYHLFTDQPIESKVYKVHRIKKSPKIWRKVKILPHRYLPGYHKWIWHDANLMQINPLIFPDGDIVCLEHPTRSCIYQEAERCTERMLEDEGIIEKQVNRYKSEGYPAGNGLIASGLMARNNTAEVNKLNKLWWEEVKDGSIRDQISFNYVAYKLNIKPVLIPYMSMCGLFSVNRHTIA